MKRNVNLKEGQTFLLTPPSAGVNCVSLSFLKGVGRISGSFGESFSDITLAFCGQSESNWVKIPSKSGLLLEALTASSIDMEFRDKLPFIQDLTWQWLFDLHLVRHPIGADARLVSLLKLLVSHFGIRTGDGYLLPFSLGHARIAELIGATRSTVTRQLTILRQQDDLTINDPKGYFLLSARIIESPVKL